MQDIFQSIRSQCSMFPPVIGWIAKEDPEGPLLIRWGEALKDTGFQLVDVSVSFSELFAQKDETEITNVKKASFLSASVLKNYVVPKLEEIIEGEKKVTHYTLMEDTENAILDPGKANLKIEPENVDICYPPIFQSGGVFDLKPDAESNDDDLYYDAKGVIICSIGARYNSYCSNVARTYLINADKLQGKAYKVLLRAHEAAIMSLRPGNTAAASYKAAVEVVQRDGPEFLPHMTKSVGTGIGIELREIRLNLNARNERVLNVGMVFNVSLGFHNLRIESDNPKTRFFSLLLSDTVIIRDEGPEIATAMCSKSVSDVLYSFNDDEEESEMKPNPKVDANGTESIISNLKVIPSSDKQEATKEEVQRQHQAEVSRQKSDENARMFTAGSSDSSDCQGSLKSACDLEAYKNVDDIPSSKELMIQVDHKNEAVLLPINGLMVPFHIATIKSASSQQDGDISYIRILLNAPVSGFNANNVLPHKFQGYVYLKELSFRSKDTRHVNQVVQLIKNLRHKVVPRESEKAERATLITQEKMPISKTKSIILSDLCIRPSFGGRERKIIGTLEGHSNGFCYSTMRQEERLEVSYRNIKHALFQPAEKEMITLIHLHLHKHIRVGSKNTKDVQFYVIVMDAGATLGTGRKSINDSDDLEAEQQGRNRKSKVNAEFNTFIKRISELWEQPHLKAFNLNFDIPHKEFGFHGVPFKDSVFIVPTDNCLVELIEFPFLVITLSNIEIVNLERVGIGKNNFDMTIIFKDFKQEAFRIDAIPSASLDCIKDWLNSKNIKYYESKMNLHWRPILKTILEDPKEFIQDGGWEFLNLQISDSDLDNSECEEGCYPSELEESELNKEDSDNASVVGFDDDKKENELTEVEGKRWDEVVAEKGSVDREHGNESGNEDTRRSHKEKSSTKAQLPNIKYSKGTSAKKQKIR
ncbi:FACT complex subunit SPT16 isoform X2 [Cryptomeria japonica]|nr:FACT complex subunit SPT16 isoform X2 [Cryptomeria japonica]